MHVGVVCEAYAWLVFKTDRQCGEESLGRCSCCAGQNTKDKGFEVALTIALIVAL